MEQTAVELESVRFILLIDRKKRGGQKVNKKIKKLRFLMVYRGCKTRIRRYRIYRIRKDIENKYKNMSTINVHAPTQSASEIDKQSFNQDIDKVNENLRKCRRQICLSYLTTSTRKRSKEECYKEVYICRGMQAI